MYQQQYSQEMYLGKRQCKHKCDVFPITCVLNIHVSRPTFLLGKVFFLSFLTSLLQTFDCRLAGLRWICTTRAKKNIFIGVSKSFHNTTTYNLPVVEPVTK